MALTLDTNEFPHEVLLVRRVAQIALLEDIAPEYAAAATRCSGEEQGRARVEQARGMMKGMARITIQPRWVGILDFQTRLPSALSL